MTYGPKIPLFSTRKSYNIEKYIMLKIKIFHIIIYP